MIAGSRVLLLETRFMFLINDDKSKLLKGQKDGTARAKNNLIGSIGKLLVPHFHTLGIAIFGMIDAQSIAKHFLQAACNLYGQGDFGQEIKHLLAPIECLLDEMDIDFGLPA